MHKILNELPIETDLKQYFKYMERTYGEEVAINTALGNEGICSSLLDYSDRFDKYQDLDVYLAIFRSCVLSKNSNVYVEYARLCISTGMIDELLIFVDSNKKLKYELIKKFLEQISLTSEQLYNYLKQGKNSRSIVSSLNKLNEYYLNMEIPKTSKHKLKTK